MDNSSTPLYNNKNKELLSVFLHIAEKEQGQLRAVSKIHVFLFSASENRNQTGSDFWSFARFYEKYYSYLGEHKVFNGIFHQYDFS